MYVMVSPTGDSFHEFRYHVKQKLIKNASFIGFPVLQFDSIEFESFVVAVPIDFGS